MRDIPLVPERDVFIGGLDVRSYHPGQPADLLARYRIPFVRHRGRTFLSFAERLLRLPDFGSLQMPDLERNLFERGGGQRERGNIRGMEIPRDDLGSNRRRPQSEPGADTVLRLVPGAPARTGR